MTRITFILSALAAGTALTICAAAAQNAQSDAMSEATTERPPVAEPIRVDSFEGQNAAVQPLDAATGPAPAEAGLPGEYYVPSTTENVTWGRLPNRASQPILTVPSGATVTVDTISHEGILEDQGRDPVAWFGQFGVSEDQVITDAVALTASELEHDFAGDGPHVVTGPIAIEGAEAGDILMIETLTIEPRVPYGVISNRHGKGALPGEYPLGPKPEENASAENPEAYNNVSIFTPIRQFRGEIYGVLNGGDRGEISFRAIPFMGLMGVATDTEEALNSVPPGEWGGNIDINEIGAGSTLYLPIEVDGGLFYTGDPHASQGDGEVALTALELSARTTFRLTVLKEGDERLPVPGLDRPFAETPDYWIPIGLNEDLDEAMKEAVRSSIGFLTDRLGIDPQTALAYLSAATDYEVSQVVDKTKGVHALIAKSDFAGFTTTALPETASAEEASSAQGEASSAQ
ncbi:hypothetical protein FP2506_09246 [Fulvimarina pelagi HTCC2506]|uniref:Acetamidase n=1 Tax=Fulvimarina pelagi HTCC2506 TaxID=314231 RepID=Q0G5P7_9HYPH|nr:acetamidase/formamidase family protein [Fulvimarina pelagi]EAU43017.1 hypothetical protein FP2506_09246 [Fulvimarina pelagi HTCC2506]